MYQSLWTVDCMMQASNSSVNGSMCPILNISLSTSPHDSVCITLIITITANPNNIGGSSDTINYSNRLSCASGSADP